MSGKSTFVANRQVMFYICSRDNERSPVAQIRSSRRVLGEPKSDAAREGLGSNSRLHGALRRTRTRGEALDSPG